MKPSGVIADLIAAQDKYDSKAFAESFTNLRHFSRKPRYDKISF